MKEPVEPNNEDCCNSGCNPCIFEVYEKQLLLYKKYQETGDVPEQTFSVNSISQINYTPFVVVDNINVYEEHNLIIFKLESTDVNNKIFWKPGSHFLVKYLSNANSYSRAYTPLKYKVNSQMSEFSILVKRYNQGIVSQYLCDLKLGQTCFWRGPYNIYENLPNKYDRIIMIAQGTGIAPFFSIIDDVLRNDDNMTKLILLYCCQGKGKILFREELYSWKRYWNFEYTIYLSNWRKDDVYMYQEPIMNQKLKTEMLLTLMPFKQRNDQILICGSVIFMDYFNTFLKSENIENIVLF